MRLKFMALAAAASFTPSSAIARSISASTRASQ